MNLNIAWLNFSGMELLFVCRQAVWQSSILTWSPHWRRLCFEMHTLPWQDLVPPESLDEGPQLLFVSLPAASFSSRPHGIFLETTSRHCSWLLQSKSKRKREWECKSKNKRIFKPHLGIRCHFRGSCFWWRGIPKSWMKISSLLSGRLNVWRITSWLGSWAFILMPLEGYSNSRGIGYFCVTMTETT